MRLVPRKAFVVLPLVVGFGASLSQAVAQEDSLRQQYEDIKNAVGLGAARAPMDFSDRPLLVVPPTNTLPPPSPGDADRLGINDPDVMARRKALSDSRRPVPPTDPGAAATGLAARTYLIDPPSGLRDPAVVAAGIQTDKSGLTPDTAAAKHVRRHKATSVVRRTPAPPDAQAAQ